MFCWQTFSPWPDSLCLAISEVIIGLLIDFRCFNLELATGEGRCICAIGLTDRNSRRRVKLSDRSLSKSLRQFEVLEVRALLSATPTATLVGTTLKVTGTDGNDFFNIAAVSGKAQVTANGHLINSTALSAITTIDIKSGSGSDLVTLRGINKHVVFDGEGDQAQLTVVGAAANNNFVLSPATSTLTVNGFAYEYANVNRLTVNGQGGKDTFTIQGAVAFPVVLNGGAGVDTLVGPNIANTWAINVANGGILNGNVQFGGMESLIGGSDVDTFVMNPGGSIGGIINGGGGTDTISYASRSTPISIDPRTNAATNVGHFVNVETVAGSAVSDSIFAPNQVNNWVISGPNVVSLNGFAYSGFENLVGNQQADVFNFVTGGYVTGKIDGKAGSDSLNFNADASSNSINLATSTFTSAGGTGSFVGIESLVGSASLNTRLFGPNANATWNITGTNSGSVAGLPFSQIGNLTGSSMNDTFEVFNGAGVSGTIDGGAGTDLLDYTNYTSAHTIIFEQGRQHGEPDWRHRHYHARWTESCSPLGISLDRTSAM